MKISVLTLILRNISTSCFFGDGNHPGYLAVKQFTLKPLPSTRPKLVSALKLEGSTIATEQQSSFPSVINITTAYSMDNQLTACLRLLHFAQIGDHSDDIDRARVGCQRIQSSVQVPLHTECLDGNKNEMK